MKKEFFCILDTETTIQDTVADIGILVCDRHGEIYSKCAVLVAGHYGNFELFHDKNANDIWGYGGLNKRKDTYKKMLEDGRRVMASVGAVNRYIQNIIGKYNPTLTAYNLAFDTAKCKNTGIMLDDFKGQFCLWQAAIGNICNTKNYRKFVIENHLFSSPTDKGNMTFKTTAESVAGYIKGNFEIEPHTAIEDAKDFELPILVDILKKRKWRDKITAYNWRNFQVNQHFVAA